MIKETEKLSIEELYKLIDEIKKDEEEYKKIVQSRKEFREFDTTLHLPRIMAYLVIFAIAANTVKEKLFSFNPFHNNKLIMSEKDKKEIISELEEKLDIAINKADEDDYILLNAVFNNSNLTQDQKKEMFDLLPLIRDNDYIDKETFYDTLGNLKINYVERPDIFDEAVIGNYFFLTNSISIYLDRENDYNDEVLKHEKIHSLFTSDVSFITKCHFLTEGMTELLMNEYFGLTPFCEYENYVYEIALVKLLCELVGEDKVLEAYTKGSMTKIYNTLDSIYGNKGDSKELLTSLDEILDNYYNADYSFSKEELKMLIKKLENYFVDKKEELLGLNEELPIEYDKRVKENAFYYYENLLLTATSNNHFADYSAFLRDVGILQKAYFSKELKEIVEKDNYEKVYSKKIKQ